MITRALEILRQMLAHVGIFVKRRPSASSIDRPERFEQELQRKRRRLIDDGWLKV